MTWARPAFQWLCWLFILGLAIQFLLGGLGVMGGESIEPHEGLGRLLQLISLFILITAALAKMGKPVIPMSATLLVLMILQSLWARLDSPTFLGALHVFGAFVIVVLAGHLAERAGFPLRSA